MDLRIKWLADGQVPFQSAPAHGCKTVDAAAEPSSSAMLQCVVRGNGEPLEGECGLIPQAAG